MTASFFPSTSGASAPTSPAWRARESLLLLAGLLVVVLCVYAGGLRTPMGSDARFLSYQNEWVRSGSGILRFWTGDMFEGAETHGVPYRSGYYRPVMNTFFWLEYRWAGTRDLLYNLTEVLLHGLNAFLVLLVITRVTRSRMAGLVGGLLFAVHPVNAFAASEPAARSDVLFAFFYLLASLLFVRALDRVTEGKTVPWGALAGVTALGALSVLSKEMGITLPAALLLLVLLRHAQGSASLSRWTWTLPAWGVLTAYVVWRFIIIDLDPASMQYGEDHGPVDMALATLATLSVHVARLLVPTGPSYPELNPEMIVLVGRGLADPLVWVSLAILALVTVLVVRWKRDPAMAFCAAFLVVASSPLVRVDNIGGTLDTSVILTQERWFYLSAVAVFAAVGLIVTRIAQLSPRRWLVPAGVAATALVLAWQASVHAGMHEDPFARLRRLYAIPEAYLGRFQMANRYLLYAELVAAPSGDLADAEDRARAAWELVPDSPITAAGLASFVARRSAWQEVRDLLLPWMYPSPEFLTAAHETNFRVYDDWNRVNPTVVLLLARAEGHLMNPTAAAALLCEAMGRGVPRAEVELAAGEIPGLSPPVAC